MKFKYWLTCLTDISNAKKKLLHDCSITAEKLFFMPKSELFDILFFTDDDRKIILGSRASYDVEKFINIINNACALLYQAVAAVA